MIIPENTPKTPITQEGDVPVSPQRSVSQHTPLQGESPPSYYGSSSQSYFRRNIPQQPYTVEEPIDLVYRYGQSPTERFFRALFVAWMVCFVIMLFIQSFIALVHRVSNSQKDGGKLDPHFDYDIPSGISLSDCVQGSEWSHQMYPEGLPTEADLSRSWKASYPGALLSAQATFDLPLNSAKTFIMARGQLSSGTLDVITSPMQSSNIITVRVNIQYLGEEMRNTAKVCKLANQVGQEPEGVGIFTPKWRDRGEGSQMAFEVTVILPEVATGDGPLFVGRFVTDVPNFLHRFADLNKKVHFGSLVLIGSNAPVDIGSLSATAANIQTKNGYIKGDFDATEFLILDTTNGPIQVDVGLRSVEGSDPVFTAHTSNNPIEATVSLLRDSPKNGTYTVVTAASNGELLLQFPAQPVDSELYLTATTSNAPVRVRLNPAFEGDFILESTAAVVFRKDMSVRDPAGAGRERLVDYKAARSEGKDVVAGTVQWGAGETGTQRWVAPSHDGHNVAIYNTNAPLTFVL